MFWDPVVLNATKKWAISGTLCYHLCLYAEDLLKAAANLQLKAVSRAATYRIHGRHTTLTHVVSLPIVGLFALKPDCKGMLIVYLRFINTLSYKYTTHRPEIRSAILVQT